MSKEHKAALARGREQARKIARYLDAINRPKPRGRQRTPASIRARLDRIESVLAEVSPIDRVQLFQERINLIREMETSAVTDDIDAYERDFVDVARDYSDRMGITYPAWREVGVPAAVLRRAEISISFEPSARRDT